MNSKSQPDLQAGAPSPITTYFEASLYGLVFTSVLMLVGTGKLDLPATILAPLALVVKGLRRLRGRSAELSHFAATILLILTVLLMPADFFFWSRSHAADAPNPVLYSALLATVHLLLAAVIIRAYSANSRRDYLFLAMMAFSCVLASAVLTVNTLFFFLFIVFMVFAVSTFISLELERASDGAVAASQAAKRPKRIVRALAITSIVATISVFALGGVIFFALPRVTGGYFSGYSIRPQLMTGFTDSVELGKIGEIKRSSEVVMRVKIEGNPSLFYGTHWRGIALVDFDGWRWSSATLARGRVSPQADGWFNVGSIRNTRTWHPKRSLKYSVLLEPVASSAIFLASDALVLRGRFGAGTGIDAARRNFLLEDSTQSVFTPFPPYSETQYDAVSYPPDATPDDLRHAGENYRPEIYSGYLQLPAIDARIPALARQITANATDPYDKASAIEDYFHKNFGYTLDLGAAPVKDPLANFLFERRAGHCEYFASAMTVMLRTLHIPARYINGFQTGEYNDVGSDFIVRASDAHSWVEAFFPGYGWVEFDPTPAGSVAQTPWYAGLHKYSDWLALTWGDWVVNYDFVRQMSLARNLQVSSRNLLSSMSDRFSRTYDATTKRMRAWQFRSSTHSWLVPVLIVFAVGSVIVIGGRRFRAWLAQRWRLIRAGSCRASGREASSLASLHYREMLHLLARRGFRKTETMTPQEFAASIPEPNVAARVDQMTQIYQTARFGNAFIDSTVAVALLRDIRFALKNITAA
ncbi:MAG TPA: DUF3488 and transglutaminase-like domain-containing protein [Candidatus Acidoferrales bacterium]|nr:DUF3488 and transglutaminase-like domain-containing protein [Candidatus Acidoferrales bacterium]